MSVDADAMTIDELARRAGLSVRNVREYQSRGLLPPPEVRGRVGYYSERHLQRLESIRELQAEGFSRKAIARLLERSPDLTEQLLSFRRAVLASAEAEPPEIVDIDELDARVGGPFEPALMRKAERIGLVRPVGEGRYEVTNATLFAAGERLAALGVPLSHALAVAERINRHNREIADAFVRLFVQDVFEPLQRDGSEPETWEATRRAVEELRPLATEALVAGFQQTLDDAIERALAKALKP